MKKRIGRTAVPAALALTVTCAVVVFGGMSASAQSVELRQMHHQVQQHYAAGRIAAAAKVAVEAVRLGVEEFGAAHPTTAALMANLAELRVELGEWAEVERLYRDVASARTTTLGAHHPDVAEAYDGLGRALAAQQRYEAAEDAYWQALQAVEQQVARRPHMVTDLNLIAALYRARAYYNRAHLLVVDGRLDDAELMYQSAIATFEASPMVDGAELSAALDRRATVLRRLGAQDEAESLEARAREVADGGPGCHISPFRSC